MAVPDASQTDVWMRWEFEKLNAGIVTRTRSLTALLEKPTLETREGETLQLDRGVLERFAAACTPRERDRLRVPITIHFSTEVSDSAYVIDERGADVLHRLEGWGDAYPYRDGKMWIPASLAVDLLLRFEGVLQRLMM